MSDHIDDVSKMVEVITWIPSEERVPEPSRKFFLVTPCDGDVGIGTYRSASMIANAPPAWSKPLGFPFQWPVIAWAEMPKGVKREGTR